MIEISLYSCIWQIKVLSSMQVELGVIYSADIYKIYYCLSNTSTYQIKPTIPVSMQSN